MKANELRVGNIIGDQYLNEVIVTPEMIAEIASRDTPTGEDGVYRPLLITEERLVKLKFAEVYGVFWQRGCVILVPRDYGYDVCINTSEHGNINRAIYNIHDLQNLYRGLYGEEL